MERKRLTKRTVDAVTAPATGEARVWDDALTGFCLRVYASGRKVYALKYRLGAAQRWATIGEHGDPWTPDTARDEATDILRAASRGVDLLAERKAAPSMAVGDLIDRYLADGPGDKPGKRAASWAQDRSNLQRHTRPLIGTKRAGEVSRADITAMVAAITRGDTATDEKTKARGRAIVRGGAGIAARTFSTTRAMFAWAIEKGLLTGANPCGGVKLAARPDAERFLTEGQAGAIFDALADLEAEGAIQPRQAAIFRLLMLTGARRREIAGLMWSEVDLEGQRLILPPERTKAGGASGSRRIALNAPAVTILSDLARERRAREPYVFPASKGKSGATTAEAKVWREKVLPRAGLTGVRIHDLRHSFASFALADGASLAMIGKALGHATARATERYAKLSDDPVRAMAERIGKRFGGGVE